MLLVLVGEVIYFIRLTSGGCPHRYDPATPGFDALERTSWPTLASFLPRISLSVVGGRRRRQGR